LTEKMPWVGKLDDGSAVNAVTAVSAEATVAKVAVVALVEVDEVVPFLTGGDADWGERRPWDSGLGG
jgi:hypothetical protein